VKCFEELDIKDLRLRDL